MTLRDLIISKNLSAVFCAAALAMTAPATAQTAGNATLTTEASTQTAPSAEFGSALDNARAIAEAGQGKSPSFSRGIHGSSHFTWGADAGSSIDMSATDMSAIDLNINIGYKGSYVRFLGIGGGITTMVNNSSLYYPLYLLFRTSFSPRPRFCFLDFRAGATFCHFSDISAHINPYGSLGLGMTLASSRRFSSHIILAYTLIPLRGEARYKLDNLHFASLRIGCSF